MIYITIYLNIISTVLYIVFDGMLVQKILQRRDTACAYVWHPIHARANIQCLVDYERARPMIRRYAINRQCFLTQLVSLRNNNR